MEFKSDKTLPEIKLIVPKVHGDTRGYFLEMYRMDLFKEAGISTTFSQTNESRSKKGVLRGIHLQKAPHAQAKCIRVTEGEIFDVAVDLRPNSKSFGQWTAYYLNETNKHLLYIPEGFGHGFYVTSEYATINYMCSNLYAPDFEQTLIYNDPDVNIKWPIQDHPILSKKDTNGLALSAFKT